jgi:hypothetical protein
MLEKKLSLKLPFCDHRHCYSALFEGFDVTFRDLEQEKSYLRRLFLMAIFAEIFIQKSRKGQ